MTSAARREEGSDLTECKGSADTQPFIPMDDETSNHFAPWARSSANDARVSSGARRQKRGAPERRFDFVELRIDLAKRLTGVPPFRAQQDRPRIDVDRVPDQMEVVDRRHSPDLNERNESGREDARVLRFQAVFSSVTLEPSGNSRSDRDTTRRATIARNRVVGCWWATMRAICTCLWLTYDLTPV